MTIQVKATEQYFPVVLFIMLYKVVLTLESIDEILKCDHSSESYRVVLSSGAVYHAAKEIFLRSVTIQLITIEEYFCAVLFVVR